MPLVCGITKLSMVNVPLLFCVLTLSVIPMIIALHWTRQTGQRYDGGRIKGLSSFQYLSKEETLHEGFLYSKSQNLFSEEILSCRSALF